MAAIHAGLKRSFHDMHGIPRSSSSPASSRETSPYSRQSRGIGGSQTPQDGIDINALRTRDVPRKVVFEPDASVVLLGIRGVGKSSLGVLAATAYNRRLIDSERAFHETTGQTNATYRKLHGPVEYRRQHHLVLKATLEQYGKGCIIICSFADLENNGSAIIQDFAQTHPVIHILRDVKGVQSYLQIWSEDRIRRLFRASAPLLRSCSNFDFFNLSAESTPADDTESRLANEHAWSEARSSNGPYLTLKRAERDFLKLLRNVIGDHERGPSHQSAYPLSQVPVQLRRWTYAVQLSAEDILSNELDLDTMQIGADAVELVVSSGVSRLSETNADISSDPNLLAKAFATMRRATILPIILTVHQNAAADRSQLPANFEAMEHCLRLAPEFCSLDLTMSDEHLERLMSTKGGTRIIGALAVTERFKLGWNDPQCLSSYVRAYKLGCDLFKITMPVESMADNFAIEAFRQNVRGRDEGVPLIAYNTGHHGRTSLCSNTVLTPVEPPRPEVLDSPSASTRLDTVSSKRLMQALSSNFVLEPLRFWIYGADVSYSLSPAMHNAAYAACGLPHSLTTVSSDTLQKFRSIIRDPSFGGSAVTQPYKTVVSSMVNALSAHAEAIGAINTVIPLRELSSDGSIPDRLGILTQRNRSGEVRALYGDNTDWIGIRACIRRGLSPANTIRPNSTALICGAGGMARSAVYSMISLGVKNIFVCNRTVERAHELANHYNILIDTDALKGLRPDHSRQTRVRVIESFATEWPLDFRQPTIVVCSIPVQIGDEAAAADFTLPANWMRSPTGGVAVELAYNPVVTPFVRQLRAEAHRGWILMDGFDMLPEQAFAQYELFTGRRAPRKLMRDAVLHHYNQQN